MGIKVCHITTVHPSRDIRIFYKECSSLAQAGYEVTLVVANGEDFSENGVNVVGIPVPFNNRIQRIMRTPEVVFKKAMEVDAEVYHFHDPEFIPSALKLLRRGKKVVYDVHEDVPRQIMAKFWIPPGIRGLVARLFEFYEDYAARKMTQIITSTPNIRNRFLRLNKNTVDINNFPLQVELLKPIQWEQKEDQVCYVGGISEERGIMQMLDAMALVDGIELNLAGNFSPESFKKKVLDSPMKGKILYWGYVDRIGTAAILGKSKVGLVTLLPMPNHVNSQPNKMFEYMAAGLPVVASHFPLWKSIVEGNNCGVCVDPMNPNEIKLAIEKILQNPEEAQLMGANGQKAVQEKYNWGQENRKLLDVYQTILA